MQHCILYTLFISKCCIHRWSSAYLPDGIFGFRTRESESKLLQDAKRNTVELEKQRMELEKVKTNINHNLSASVTRDVYFGISVYSGMIPYFFLNARIFPEYRSLLQNKNKMIYFQAYNLGMQNSNTEEKPKLHRN